MEVLREFAASLNARYSRYMSKHGLEWEDENNLVVSYDREINASKDAILDCNTLEELKVFEDRLKELRSIIERLEEECRKKGLRDILKMNILMTKRQYFCLLLMH